MQTKANTILVGASGPIGRALAEATAAEGSGCLVLVGNDAAAIAAIAHQTPTAVEAGRMILRVASPDDGASIAKIVGGYPPPRSLIDASGYVFSGLMETNACEAVRRNLLTAQDLFKAAARNEAERFVLVTTHAVPEVEDLLSLANCIAEIYVEHEARNFAGSLLIVRCHRALVDETRGPELADAAVHVARVIDHPPGHKLERMTLGPDGQVSARQIGGWSSEPNDMAREELAGQLAILEHLVKEGLEDRLLRQLKTLTSEVRSPVEWLPL